MCFKLKEIACRCMAVQEKQQTPPLPPFIVFALSSNACLVIVPSSKPTVFICEFVIVWPLDRLIVLFFRLLEPDRDALATRLNVVFTTKDQILGNEFPGTAQALNV